MRIEGWETKLLEVVAYHESTPFDWADSNCLHLMMDVSLALTGRDPYAKTRGKYKNQAGAMKVMRKLGFRDVGEMIAAEFAEVPPAMARRGDLALLKQGDNVVGAVVMGAQVWGKGPMGSARVPRTAALRTFKVGW